MDTTPSLMEKCTCGGEAIEVQYWGDDDSENEFYFSLWRNEFKRPLCWRERLRWCWRILRTGDPWADGIIVSSTQANRVAEFIKKYQSNGKKEETTGSCVCG